jgi:hypothetical protein
MTVLIASGFETGTIFLDTIVVFCNSLDVVIDIFNFDDIEVVLSVDKNMAGF